MQAFRTSGHHRRTFRRSVSGGSSRHPVVSVKECSRAGAVEPFSAVRYNQHNGGRFVRRQPRQSGSANDISFRRAEMASAGHVNRSAALPTPPPAHINRTMIPRSNPATGRRRSYAPDPAAPPDRMCDIPGCTEAGEFRAPKSRSQLNDYHWFCLDHVRAYNAGWDFYKGMSPAEVEAQLRADTGWQRPTWPLG